ncbi:MAG TPA: LysR family transcriptional regulator [Verrucomicrobiae bacterium]|nr:LysR family transcriptional regulator [Verrucomicrobiae bacterium]
MTIEELKSFVVLAGHLHFGRAAQVLHLSQPALTKQIRRLEESLGGRLLERDKHGTKLSAFGARVLPQAEAVVDSFNRLREDARKIAEGRAGCLRVGFGTYTQELVPRMIVKLRALEPGIEITLRDMSTSEQIAALQADQLDVGFTRLPLPPAVRDCEALPIITGHLVLVGPARAAGPRHLSLDDCRDQPFVILSKQRSSGLYNLVMALCARHGFHPRIVQEVSELTTALALVKSGMGFTILPETLSARRFGGVKIQSLNEKGAAWTVGAVWRRRDTSPVLQRFLGLLRQEIA